MKALRVELKQSKFHNGHETVKNFYNFSLPHFVPKLRDATTNYVAISCFPSNLSDNKVKNSYIEYIRDNKKDDDTIIYFDNVYEGHVYSCLSFIHDIISLLNLLPANCIFVTGAMNAHELYAQWCFDKSINEHEKINIFSINAWERHIKYTTPEQLTSENRLVVELKEKKFLCFNRIFRPQRLALLGLLYKNDLVKDGYYSFFPDCTYSGPQPPDIKILRNYLSTEIYDEVIKQYITHEIEMPLLLNNKDAAPTNYILDSDLDYYRNSYFSLVTETFFFSNIWPNMDEHAVFFSEKIFKPIICKHPFLLVGRPKSLNYLKKIGYRTFHPYINETYDDIENDQERLVAIVNEVSRLCNQTDDEWLSWLKNISEIVDFNYEVLKNKKIEDHQFKMELNSNS
jgi:hypothetical protein